MTVCAFLNQRAGGRCSVSHRMEPWLDNRSARPSGPENLCKMLHKLMTGEIRVDDLDLSYDYTRK